MPPFKRPTPDQIRAAVGPLDDLPAFERAALDPDNAPGFAPLPRPRPGDWLAERKERLQTLASFQRRSYCQGPHAYFTQLALRPVGPVDAPGAPLDTLARFVGAYLGVEAVVGGRIPLEEVSEGAREGFDGGQLQLRTGTVLQRLRADPPRRAFAQLAVSLVDLFPRDDYNFVFGIASLMDGVGVFSLARYDPAFTGEQPQPRLMLRRAIGVLVHESGHLLGLKHCVSFACIMNGSNHLEEADAKPKHFCPVCLRKLLAVTGVRLEERYCRLRALCLEHGLEDEAAWFTRRLEALGAGRVEPDWGASAVSGSAGGVRAGRGGGRGRGRKASAPAKRAGRRRSSLTASTAASRSRAVTTAAA